MKGLFTSLRRGLAATRKGKILLHPAMWKNLRVVIVGTVAVGEITQQVACAVDSTCYGLTDVKVHAYAQVAGWLLFFGYNLWTEWATSTKVGWGRVEELIESLVHEVSKNDQGDEEQARHPEAVYLPGDSSRMRRSEGSPSSEPLQSASKGDRQRDKTSNSSRKGRTSLDEFMEGSGSD